jgi:hypothetical protein
MRRSEAALMRPGVPSQVQAFAQRQSEVSPEETLRRLIAHRERLREERARSLALERSLYLVRTNPELDFEPFLIIRGEGADGGRARIHFNSGDRC